MAIIDITEENFEQEVMNSDIPVIIDFWAPWCDPCQYMLPIYQEACADIEAAGIPVKTCTVNVTDANTVAARFGIKRIPTFITVKGKQMVDYIVGMCPKDDLINLAKAAVDA